MFCQKCGKQLTDGAKFCSTCGFPAPIPAPPKSKPTVKTPEPIAETAKEKTPIYYRWWLWVIVLIVAIVVVLSLTGGDKHKTETEQDITTEQHEVTSAPPQHSDVDKDPLGVLAENDENSETEIVDDDGFTAAQRELLLQESAMWGVVIGSEYQFQETMDTLGDVGGSVTIYDAYSACKSCATSMSNSFNSVYNFRDMPEAKEYVDACQTYIINMQKICEDLMEFLDENSVSAMSDAEDRLARLPQYQTSVATERISFYMANGFTMDQIDQIIAED